MATKQSKPKKHKLTELEVLKRIVMRILRRHLSLESDLYAISSILGAKGIVTYGEFIKATEGIEQEIHDLARKSKTDTVEEMLRKFKGTKQ